MELTSIRPLHARVPIVVLVLINLSLSPLSSYTLFRDQSPTKEEEDTCRLAGAWNITLMFCDTPAEPAPPLANNMAAIGSVVHLQSNGLHYRQDDPDREYISTGYTYMSTRCVIQAPCIFPAVFSMSACRGTNRSWVVGGGGRHMHDDEHRMSNRFDWRRGWIRAQFCDTDLQ